MYSRFICLFPCLQDSGRGAHAESRPSEVDLTADPDDDRGPEVVTISDDEMDSVANGKVWPSPKIHRWLRNCLLSLQETAVLIRHLCLESACCRSEPICNLRYPVYDTVFMGWMNACVWGHCMCV